MDINVIRVEANNSVKYGNRKILHVDDGTKWNVAEKKPFYNIVTGPGVYSVEISEFNGKPYIKTLSKKGTLNTGAATSAPAKQTSSTGYDYKAKLEADKKRQDEIALEFYCGLVKDCMIANKTPETFVDYNTIQDEAFKLFKNHKRLLEMADAQEEPAKAEAKSTFQKAKEALAEEEPPF